MIVDSRGGLTLHTVRLRGYWRRWLWIVRRPGGWATEGIEGRAWTRRGAIAHGNICRTLMLAAGSPVATRRPQEDELEGWRHG